MLPEGLDPDPVQEPGARSRSFPASSSAATLAKNLGAKLGDCLQVTSPTIGFVYSRGAMHAPVAKQFRVIAVFEAGFDQYDSKLVYTDLYEAQAFYDSGDSVTGVEMKVERHRAGARRRRSSSTDKLASGIYHTMDWEELNHGLFTALRIQQIVMSLVLALIIVVAAFTVIATLIMVVLDKKKEIAVLKAMGATDGAILRVFLYQGGIIGVSAPRSGSCSASAVCKVLLAYGFPLDPKVYFISHLPVAMHLERLRAGRHCSPSLVCLGRHGVARAARRPPPPRRSVSRESLADLARSAGRRQLGVHGIFARRSRPSTRALSSGARNGLLTKSSAPASKAVMSSSLVECAVKNRIGQRSEARLAPELAAEIDAAHAGQRPVEDDEIHGVAASMPYASSALPAPSAEIPDVSSIAPTMPWSALSSSTTRTRVPGRARIGLRRARALRRWNGRRLAAAREPE